MVREPQLDSAELAFESLRAEVIVMRRTVEGLVDQLDETDVARRTELIANGVVRVLERLDKIIEADAITSPTLFHQEMIAAREKVLRPAQDSLQFASRELRDATGWFNEAVGRLSDHRAQRELLWRVAGASALAGLLAFPLIVLPLASVLPDSWGIPDALTPSAEIANHTAPATDRR